MKGFARKSIMVVSNIETINKDSENLDYQIERVLEEVSRFFIGLQEGIIV